MDAVSTWRNGPERYGSVARGFHWTMVILMVAAFALGSYAASFPRGDPWREEVLVVHKSLGLLVLVLAATRVLWTLANPAPALPTKMKAWERRLAKVVHWLLYAAIFAVPVSGLMLSQGAGREVGFFGWLTLPQIVPIDPAVPPVERPIVAFAAVAHKVVLYYALIVIVALHVLGVVKHHYVDRDPAMIRRMWGR